MDWASQRKEELTDASYERVAFLEGQIKMLQCDKEQKKYMIDCLNIKLSEEKKKFNEEVKIQNQLLNDVQKLSDTCKKFERDHAKLQMEVRVREDRIRNLGDQLSKAIKENSKMNEEVKIKNQLRNDIQKLLDTCKKFEGDHAKLEMQLEVRDDNIRNLGDQLSEAINEKRKMNEKLIIKNQQLNDIQKRFDTCKKFEGDHAKLEMQLKVRDDDIRNLGDQLSEAINENRKMSEEFKIKNQQLNDTCKKWEESHAKLDMEVKKHDSRIRSLEDHLPQAQNENTKIISKEECLSLEKYTYKDQDDVKRTREIASQTLRQDADNPDCVGALAVLRRRLKYDCLVLVKQYRPALKQHTLELPAGLVIPTEKPEETAIRELNEETGYVTETVKHSSPWTAADPGLSRSRMKIVTLEVNGDQVKNRNPKQSGHDSGATEVIHIPIDELLTRLNDISEQGVIIDSRVYCFAIGLTVGAKNACYKQTANPY